MIHSSTIERNKREFTMKLQRELGEEICAALGNDDVIEVLVNSDGVVWHDTLSRGMVRSGGTLAEPFRENVIGTVAAYHDQVVTKHEPSLQAELPLNGERFQGMIRPVSDGAMFVIRKHLKRVFSMQQMVENGTVTPEQAAILIAAILDEKNVLYGGKTLSGKTVILDTHIYEMAQLFGENLRVVVLEDTFELHGDVPNRVYLHTTKDKTLRVLVQETMRLSPRRMIIGEVRGGEALDMLKAWESHGGGACTIHGRSVEASLKRLKQAVQEAIKDVDMDLIGGAVDLVVMMERRGASQWRVAEIVECEGWDGKFQLRRRDGPTITIRKEEELYANGWQKH